MGKITYKYIDPPRTAEQSIAFMRDTFIPLINEYWKVKGEKTYHARQQINILSLVQMWTMGSLLIIVAYDGDKPCGFFLGVRFTPLLFDATAVQAEVYYAPDPDVEKGLFEYLMNIIHFMDINEVWIHAEAQQELGRMPWPMRNDFHIRRYVKE